MPYICIFYTNCLVKRHYIVSKIIKYDIIVAANVPAVIIIIKKILIIRIYTYIRAHLDIILFLLPFNSIQYIHICEYQMIYAYIVSESNCTAKNRSFYAHTFNVVVPERNHLYFKFKARSKDHCRSHISIS